jgi:hypothetical protein
MIKIISLLLAMPAPVLITFLMVAAGLVLVFLVLLAFVPQMAERLIALVKALRGKGKE